MIRDGRKSLFIDNGPLYGLSASISSELLHSERVDWDEPRVTCAFTLEPKEKS